MRPGEEWLISMLWHDGWGAGSWVVMSVMMLVFWSFVIGGVVFVVRGQRSRSAESTDRARQILDERFARGELTDVEYRQRRDLLTAR